MGDADRHLRLQNEQTINQWFSDLGYYESTLEQIAASKLNDSFREELRAIEQWFVVLSDPERTAALYSLIKHTTPMQQRFFITVLQQMSGKDFSSVPSAATPQITTGFVKHSSAPAPVKGDFPDFPHDSLPDLYTKTFVWANAGTDMDLLTIATGNSLRLSLEPKTPVDAAIAQADWSQQPTPQLSADPVRRSPIIQPRTFSAHPGDGWAHVSLASAGRSLSKGGVSGSDFSEYDEFGYINGSTGTGVGVSGKEKGKIPDVVDLALLNDIPSWLRSLRLHKYEFAFQNCTWRDMVKMNEAELARRGVTTLGARNKLLKVFEIVKAECAKSLIPI
ncbi:Flap-structured DNA-binding and RNA-binding protein [Entophlyctis luteolus]|nr:Flap-structured DNA-binding and RNA-binding protein [Entophlyctis luteolus]